MLGMIVVALTLAGCDATYSLEGKVMASPGQPSRIEVLGDDEALAAVSPLAEAQAAFTFEYTGSSPPRCATQMPTRGMVHQTTTDSNGQFRGILIGGGVFLPRTLWFCLEVSKPGY